MTRLTLAVVFLIGVALDAQAGCVLSHCKTDAPSTREIRSNWESGRQRLGDLYDPGRGGRVQIRNNSRQILGFIERDGTITNRHRQPVAEILPPAP